MRDDGGWLAQWQAEVNEGLRSLEAFALCADGVPPRYAADVRLADAGGRIDRARAVLSAFLDEIGDAPFGLADVVARALNELEGGA